MTECSCTNRLFALVDLISKAGRLYDFLEPQPCANEPYGCTRVRDLSNPIAWGQPFCSWCIARRLYTERQYRDWTAETGVRYLISGVLMNRGNQKLYISEYRDWTRWDAGVTMCPTEAEAQRFTQTRAMEILDSEWMKSRQYDVRNPTFGDYELEQVDE